MLKRMRKTLSMISIIFVILTATNSVKCQNGEDEDDEENTNNTVEEREESAKLTDAPPKKESPKEAVTESAGSSAPVAANNQALLNALLLMAINNNNANEVLGPDPTLAPTTAPLVTEEPAETEEPSSTTREAYVVGQIGKILGSVARGNISGIVDNAVKIGAPASVQTMMSTIMTTLNSWTGGVFGIQITTTPPPEIGCGPPARQSVVQPPPGQLNVRTSPVSSG